MVSNTATAARQWPPKSCFFPGLYKKSSVTLDTRVSEVYFQASQDNMLRLVYFSKKNENFSFALHPLLSHPTQGRSDNET